MPYEDMDCNDLRREFKAYMLARNYSKNYANTAASSVFYLWNKRGKEVFWHAVRADEKELREIMRETIEAYSPQRTRDLNMFLMYLRFFRSYVSSDESYAREKRIHRSGEMVPPDKPTKHLLSLSGDLLEAEHKLVLSDPGYGADYALIDSLFKRFPSNTDPEIVAMKIALIDMTNSTNIGRHRQKIIVSELAKIIVDIPDFDVRLRQGDPSLVPIIAKCNGNINMFSFASKYCTYHAVDIYGNDDYVIYDRVVKKALPRYVAGLRPSTIEAWRKTYNYNAYKKCIDDLLDANSIHIPLRHRKLDHYLWHTYK